MLFTPCLYREIVLLVVQGGERVEGSGLENSNKSDYNIPRYKKREKKCIIIISSSFLAKKTISTLKKVCSAQLLLLLLKKMSF